VVEVLGTRSPSSIRVPTRVVGHGPVAIEHATVIGQVERIDRPVGETARRV
jgi:hypothetical protein